MAAMAVVLFHVPFTLTRTVGWTVLPDGPLGVSFFFILSGFILSHVYGGTRFGVANFYRKRLARIYPLHVLTLLAWIVLFFGQWGNSLPDRVNSGIANVLLLHAFFSGPLFNLGYNAVSWSISVEAFFYLLFPILVRRNACYGLFIAYTIMFLVLPPS